MARLTEVLRRRETLMAAALPASAGKHKSSTAMLPVDPVRQLTMAEYRAAESQVLRRALPSATNESFHSGVITLSSGCLARSPDVD